MSDKMQDFLIKNAEDLKNFIGKMAQQLGVAAEHLYGVLIRQQMIAGVEEICYWIFSVIILCIFSHNLKKVWRKCEETNEEFYVGLMICFAIGTGICSLVVIFGFGGWFTDGIKHLSNPEYYALQDIFTFIKGNVTQVTK